MKKDNDVYGIAPVSIELVLEVDEGELARVNIAPGENRWVDLDQRDRILKAVHSKKENLMVGGNLASVFKAASNLGIRSSMTCKIGMDEFGMVCQKELERTSMTTDFKIGFGCTDSNIILETGGNKPAVVRHKGISSRINYQDVDVLKTRASRCVLIQSSLIEMNSMRRAIMFMARMAKENNTKIILDMDSPKAIMESKDELKSLMDISDIIVLPYDQAYLLLEQNDTDQIIKMARKEAQTLVLKESKRLTFVTDKDNFSISGERRSKVSGNHFIAGMIFGTAMGYKLRDTARIAAYMSTKDIIDENILDELNSLL